MLSGFDPPATSVASKVPGPCPEQQPHPDTSPAVSAFCRAGAGPPAGWCSAVPEPPGAGGTAS